MNRRVFWKSVSFPGLATILCDEAACSYYEVQLWNQLPDDIKNAPAVSSFKSRLQETESLWGESELGTVVGFIVIT